MVNRELDSTPPIPAVDREFWQRSPRYCQAKPRRHPRRGFRYSASCHGTRLCVTGVSERGIGLGSQAAEPSTFTCTFLLFRPKRHCSCILVSDEDEPITLCPPSEGLFLRTLPAPPGLRAGARSTGRRSAPSTAAAASPTDLVDNCNRAYAAGLMLLPCAPRRTRSWRHCAARKRDPSGRSSLHPASRGHSANAANVPQCETHSGGLKPELSTTRLSRGAGFHALCSESDAQT